MRIIPAFNILKKSAPGRHRIPGVQIQSDRREAFQLAGARTVVMSLWSVPDEETAALMADFYGRLAAGEGKARALQNAMLAQLQSRRERYGAGHPLYWGAFVCAGEP